MVEAARVNLFCQAASMWPEIARKCEVPQNTTHGTAEYAR